MLRVVVLGACRRFCAPRSGVGGGWLSAAAQGSRRSPPPPPPPVGGAAAQSSRRPPPPVGGGWALSAAAQSSRRPLPVGGGRALSAAAQSSRRPPPPPPPAAVDRATRLGFSTSSASSAAAARILFGPKAPETLVKRMMRVKVILTLVGLLVTFLFCDTAFLVWRLSHPLLPDFSLPEPHVEMSEAEAELLDMMNRGPRFVVVYGIPGRGKTTTILSAAKRRGKAVLYYSVGACGSLKEVEEKFEEEYGAVFPSLHELVTERSGTTVWDRLAVAGGVWRRWLRASSPLVIILDNANKLDDRDLYRMADIGKRATDGGSFSIWLVSSEEQGLGMLEGQSDALTRAGGHSLPSIPEQELVRFVDKALGSHGKFTTDLAEAYVYLAGSSLALLWSLVQSTLERRVESQVFPQLMQCEPAEELPAKEFMKKVLDGGVHLKRGRIPSTVEWSCLSPEKGVVKIRNRRCRDLISLRVAQAEVAAAEDKVAAAEARWWWWWKVQKALKELEDARRLRDKAADVLSNNMQAVFDALSTYYNNTQAKG